jgi:hypothetical protein
MYNKKIILITVFAKLYRYIGTPNCYLPSLVRKERVGLVAAAMERR